MKEKFCIFCGQPPKDKNLEHVIPQWLIRMTGREHKDVFTHFPEEHRHLNFLQFKFPACTACNTKYAELEAKIKNIMEKIFAEQSISGEEISLLLDWFDKVRVGMWLSEMFYNPKLKHEIQPHFFIDSRVGKADRFLSIRKYSESSPTNKGIYVGGTNTALFNYCPSAFTMIINNYYFINASSHNLVSPRVGFPTIAAPKVIDKDKGVYECDIVKGRGKIVNPIIKDFAMDKDAITFYQPIYKDFVSFPDYPKDEYLLNHSYDTANGIGGVFVQKGIVGNTRYLQPNDKVGMKLKQGKDAEIEKDTLLLQNAVHKQAGLPNTETELGVAINNILLNSMEHKR